MSGAEATLAERLRRETGLALSGSGRRILTEAVERLDVGGPAELLRRLDDPAEGWRLAARLIDEVTVKETFFFRHPDELQTIDWHALHAAARARGDRRVRVWCVACATGEEAYSLAMLALEAFAPAPAPVDVLATDLVPSALERARAGRYGPRSVARVPAGHRDRWMTSDGDGLRVDEPLRAMVRFAGHNLVRDPAPPIGEAPFDLVTCRNVLMYFDADDAARALGALHGALHRGGWLVLGAADRLAAGPAGRAAHGPAPAVAPSPRHEPTAQLDPDAATCLAQGRDARGRGAHDEAVRWLRRALYVDPTCAEAGLELALAHESLGDERAAQRALWSALQAAQAAGRHREDPLVVECRERLRGVTA